MPRPEGNPVQLGYQKLGRIVEDVCHFGRLEHEGPLNTKSYRVVKKIFRVITAMTKRYGSLEIEGFGTFYIHNRPEIKGRKKHPIVNGVIDESKWVPIVVPAKKQIRWKPTEEFKKVLLDERTEISG